MFQLLAFFLHSFSLLPHRPLLCPLLWGGEGTALGLMSFFSNLLKIPHGVGIVSLVL